jgi:2-polyprenyl-6-methoxyphenol hydroxylase-like FAD-dependent oxidoreductase
VDTSRRRNYLESVSHRILIIGASYAGMCSALALYRKGFDVQIAERSDTAYRRGSGVVVQPRMEEYLTRNGLESREAIGVSPVGRRLFRRDGTVEELPMDGTYYTGWDTLLNRLEESLPEATIHRGRDLVDLEVGSDSVTAMFRNGPPVTAEVLIGADGIGSRTRKILDSTAVPEFAGYVAYRGVVSEKELSKAHRPGMNRYFNIVEMSHGQFLSYPISGAEGRTGPGERRVNWVWYVPDSQDAPDSLRDRQGVLHRSTVAPGLVREDVKNHIIGIANREFPPQFQELVAGTEEPFVQRVLDMMPRKMVFGRAVLLGDAASIVRPHTGSGSAKAVEDATRLAEYLAAAERMDDCTAVETRLSAWEAERISANRSLVERGRTLASEFGIDE